MGDPTKDDQQERAMNRRKPGEDEEAATPGVQGTQALTRGIALLNLVADSPAPLRFAEIADRAGLARPTAHRILAALVEARMLRQDPLTQTYALGSRFLEMAHRVWEGFDLRATAAPELERLARLAGETARLAVLDGDGVLYVDQREAEQEAVRLVNRVGARALPHASACGKAMLAQLPAAERRALLDRIAPLAAPGPRTITEAAADQRGLRGRCLRHLVRHQRPRAAVGGGTRRRAAVRQRLRHQPRWPARPAGTRLPGMRKRHA